MSEEQIQDDVLISEIENSPISETPMSNRDVEQEIKIAELDIKKEELESKRQDRLQRNRKEMVPTYLELGIDI